MSRVSVLKTIADRIASLQPGHPVRVGIDGADAAGKTTFADELAPVLAERGRPVVRASIDSFHHPAHLRYRRGSDSPEGYFLDSFDLISLRALVLDPLGPGGSLEIRRAIFDFRLDRPVTVPAETIAPDAILVFDGVFLHRDELFDCWEFSVFLEVDFETCVRRGEVRDAQQFGSRERARARYEQRYVPGQKLYLAQCQPTLRASIVIQNGDATS
ncbi:MAG TPA: hypothetical protein VNN72_24570 [Polyangiaceae bacterium]|nr:hypothetical protein [Polyangiaceae bacterium]